MKVTNVTGDKVECVLTKDQLLMIKNCVRETCSELELEFHTRVGFKIEEAIDFAEQVNRIVDEHGIEE
jgi:hypothetical protein